MSEILATLAPVVLLVATGAVLLQRGFYDDRFRRNLDRLVYWVSVPGLIIPKLAAQATVNPEAAVVTYALLGATVGAMIVAYALARALRLPPPARGVFVQAGFRGNLAFLALPVIVLAVADTRFVPEQVETLAVLVLAPMMLFYNIAAVVVLELARSHLAWPVIPKVIRSILSNPILLSAVAGIVLGVTRTPIPAPIRETLTLVGATAAPLALLSLGGTLIIYEVRALLVRALGAALVKVAVVPFLAWTAGRALAIDDDGMVVLMVYASSPTAVASYVMASQLGGDEALAASALVMSTILSAGSLAAALTWAV